MEICLMDPSGLVSQRFGLESPQVEKKTPKLRKKIQPGSGGWGFRVESGYSSSRGYVH